MNILELNSWDANSEGNLAAKFRIFIEAAPDAMIVINKNGTIVMLNSLAEQLFGYPHNEIINQSIEILVPDHLRRMGVGQPLTGKKKDGTEFPVEISLGPLSLASDDFVISIIRDTTSHQKLEAKFRGLLESAPDGIVVVGAEAKIVIVNSQTEIMFGYTRAELLGQAVEILIPAKFKSDHVKYRDGYIQNPNTRPMGAGRILSGRKKDGSELPVEISLSPLETEQGVLIMSIIRDITDRRRDEEQIRTALREKEALLKEIHHRVKNNLQVTSSLLRLQSSYIQDPRTLEMFADSQNRIQSMALVHEKLYKSSDLSRINFSEYAENLAHLLFKSFGVNPSQIFLKLQKKPVFMSVETAIPCGLILNELLSNCLKHAFPNGKNGEITLIIEAQENFEIKLEVADNGKGFPDDFSFERTETLGLQLVRTLVDQIGGKIQVRNNNGTSFVIYFCEPRNNL